MEYLDLCLRLFCALVAGAMIGVTRERIYKPAGLRTHSLICVGAAFITVLSTTVFVTAEHGDPGRVAAQIVSGIGFLGAGTILKKGFSVKGLTTAATLWVTAAVGMGFGSGEYLLSTVVTVFAIMIVLFLKRIELFTGGRNLPRILIVASNTEEMSRRISEWFKDNGLTVESMEVEDDEENLTLLIEISKSDAIKIKNLMVGLSRLRGIRSVELR
ncbi:magnesium transporter MgtC [Mesotoga sp. Brook.08.YT.4.2.5.1]|uniref:MgtC/SapB family protein n=1 Tax=unclassified Mesotoga TaxID=1184398 RepID=UPI000AFDBF2E|nr:MULTISPECIES: MgtC/SapB family protein [unclassified Mesotoga]PNQ05054.1 magnesium transporter MgtC [Mesotoga sp. SC_NapDC3]PXF34108.1 magnesium transporter MgtC [Mesotoga sp. SC_NapDC]MDD3460308.1 MgtC/SapB family protein [Mesotoga sp.]PNE23483.1 magnesium transporter MgtC [Mesotoga sp. Brook.08.YT.4.2.5.1]PNS38783.1 magnesium transporter MgtC [Mesotoga sp. B105.6.4]